MCRIFRHYIFEVGGEKITIREGDELKSKCRKMKKMTKKTMKIEMEKTMRMKKVRGGELYVRLRVCKQE